MAGRTPVLLRLEDVRVEGNRRGCDVGADHHLLGCLVSVVQGMPELQSCNPCFLVHYFLGESLFWSAHNSIWLRISRRALGYPPTLPSDRKCTPVAHPAPILSLGKHSWFVVHRDDHFLDHRRRRPLCSAVGND